MSTHSFSLLSTKLHRPPVIAETVHRKRLHEVMDRALELPLTLVSAPAGYGKSTLVSDWAQTLDEPCAWLSLDPGDSDLEVFLPYLLAAIETVVPDACPATRALARATNPVPLPVLGGSLVNELDALDSPLVLVLDDYHRIEPASSVHEFLWFLLEHPPPALRLVLATRSDPTFSIGSLRGRGRLTEVRLGDLRFTASETSEYLERTSGVKASEEALANLAQQTEGWVVALRLVSIYLRHADDPEAFLKRLHGGIQHTREYLLEEVLDRLPTRIRDCMLKTSILDRFCPELCDAVAPPTADSEEPAHDGFQFIQALTTGNFFIIPLDIQGRWFRYHHLFQEMLQEQLEARRSPGEITALHLSASVWFEANDLIGEALQHALRAGDVERAVRLVEDNRVDLLDNDQWYVLEEWLRLLPPEMREARPALLLADAWSAYERFQFDRLAAILEKVKTHLVPDAPAPSWSGELHLLLGEIQYWSGEGGRARRIFEEAREELPRKHGLVRGLLELQYGLALLMDGERERAIESLEELIREKGTEEGIYLSRLVAGLFFVHYLSGNLVGARAEGRRWHAVASRSGIAYTDAWSSYVRACGALQAGDLAGARRHFADAAEHRYILHARAAVDALAGLALTQQLTDHSEAAAESLDLLHQFALELADYQYLSVAQSSRARLALLRGEPEQAFEWARSVREEPFPAGLFMFLEVPWITRARVLIAEGAEASLAAALELLATIRCQSEGCRFTNQTIEVTVLQALALNKQGRSGEALDTLHEALAMAELGGWIRPFVEAGPPMAELIRALSVEHVATAFVEKILSATSRLEAGPTRVKRPPLDLLTDREAEILELLPQRLQNKEIATRLFISPQTVNSHLKNVYQKLGVGNRRQAVMRAVELGLLPLD